MRPSVRCNAHYHTQPERFFSCRRTGHFRRDTTGVYAYIASVMSSLTISIPDSVRQRAESLALEDGVSLDAFVASVLSQRVAVAEADSYIRLRAQRGSAEKMLNIPQPAPQCQPDSFHCMEP